jgi:hypothetical protein
VTTCLKHKNYAVKRAPTGDCRTCWKMWWEAVTERMRAKPAKKGKGK